MKNLSKKEQAEAANEIQERLNCCPYGACYSRSPQKKYGDRDCSR